jgi:hypothetical protein
MDAGPTCARKRGLNWLLNPNAKVRRSSATDPCEPTPSGDAGRAYLLGIRPALDSSQRTHDGCKRLKLLDFLKSKMATSRCLSKPVPLHFL